MSPHWRLSRHARLLICLALVAALTSSAWAEVCKGSKIPVSQLRKYDRDIFLTAEELQQSENTHLPFGQPSCRRYLYQRESVVCYDVGNRVAVWAAYRLRATDIIHKVRRDAFRTDPRLTDVENAHCADYVGSGYDRGHVVPRDDMNRTFAAQAYTFYLSNMTPQAPALNRGMWRWLEQTVRAWATKFNEIYVITGSIFDREPAPTVPSGNVAVPQRFFKIIVRRDNGALITIAIALPNDLQDLPVPPGTMGVSGRRITGAEADAFLAQSLVTVQSIEQATGIDFFPGLPATTKDALERAVASDLWPRN